jgi:hypothetical protein
MRWVTSCVLCISALTAGCSGGGSSDSTCSLDSSGGDGVTSWAFDGDPACVIPFGGSVGIDMFFAPLSGEPKHVIVEIEDVHEGELGTFPATFSVELPSGAEFKTTAKACTVTLTEHADTGESDQFSRTFQTAGSGQCPDATQVGGSDTVTIDPFVFRFPAGWPARP